MNEAFLDTAYAIALAVSTDAYHNRAIELSISLEKQHTKLVTTRAIILEIGNALSRQKYRSAAVELLDAIDQDPTIECVPLSETLYAEAFELFRERPDKDWSLVDCASFIVMKQRGMTAALTTDEHFEQAGFQALLRTK